MPDKLEDMTKMILDKKFRDGRRYFPSDPTDKEKVYWSGVSIMAHAIKENCESSYIVEFEDMREGISGDSDVTIYEIGKNAQNPEIVVKERFIGKAAKGIAAAMYKVFRDSDDISREVVRYQINKEEYVSNLIRRCNEKRAVRDEENE